MGKRQRRRLREQSQPVTRYSPATIDPRQSAEDEATARLKRLVDQRAVIEREIDAEIDRLECSGFTWPTIARALGVSRQATRQRHLRRRASGLPPPTDNKDQQVQTHLSLPRLTGFWGR
jgi:hypothetical protein